MKILVCGGRDFSNCKLLHLTLSKYSRPDLVIIHGAAKGADSMAGSWAKAFGYEVRKFPANWKEYGKRAGYIRNAQMLNEGKPDLVVAFPGGKGTQMMIKLSEAAGVPVVKINA